MLETHEKKRIEKLRCLLRRICRVAVDYAKSYTRVSCIATLIRRDVCTRARCLRNAQDKLGRKFCKSGVIIMISKYTRVISLRHSFLDKYAATRIIHRYCEGYFVILLGTFYNFQYVVFSSILSCRV